MKISELVMHTASVDLLATFYRHVLELDVEATGDRFIIQTGYTKITFVQTKRNEQPFYHFAFTIPANKIEEAKLWLEQRVELLWIKDYNSVVADFVNWHAQSLYFFDVAGNIVEFIARFDLNNAMNEPFHPKQMLSVSEIGLVFEPEEIETKTLELTKNFHVEYFSKQQPFPLFKALGNDEGLFIVVSKNRAWYPTEKASGIFPLHVSFEEQGKLFTLNY